MFPRKREQVGVGDCTEETVLEDDFSIVNNMSKVGTVFAEKSITNEAHCSLNEHSRQTKTLVNRTPSTDFTSHFVVRRNAANFDVPPNNSNESVSPSCQTEEVARSIPPITPTPFPVSKLDEYSPHCSSVSRPWTCCGANGPGKSVESSEKSVYHQRKKILHPFMTPSPLSNTKKELCMNFLCSPESPMDSSYQAISRFCSRKPKNQVNNNSGSDIPSPYECVLWSCSQECPIPINNIFSAVEKVEKIGEGVYGEVYSGAFKYFSQSSWVYKIVAIEGKTLVNGERQKTFTEILPEILVSQELSKLRHGLNDCYTDGYVYMRNARVAKGKYPTELVKSWETFHEKYESDNDKPEFQPEQLYMVLEFEFAGQDIESFNFVDARQTFSIVLQVAHILAVGECALEFEHRDLHWGNILVEEWQPFHINYILNGQTLLVPAIDVKAVVIDFTISRVKAATKQPVFLDLKEDEEQFLGTGDHQFDIYRMMRDHNRNQWDKFSPKSNIFWLHYLAEKLFVKGEYSTPKSPYHIKALRKLREFSTMVFEYDSAMTFVFSSVCDSYKEFLTSSAVGPPSPSRRARTAV